MKQWYVLLLFCLHLFFLLLPTGLYAESRCNRCGNGLAKAVYTSIAIDYLIIKCPNYNHAMTRSSLDVILQNDFNSSTYDIITFAKNKLNKDLTTEAQKSVDKFYNLSGGCFSPLMDDYFHHLSKFSNDGIKLINQNCDSVCINQTKSF